MFEMLTVFNIFKCLKHFKLLKIIKKEKQTFPDSSMFGSGLASLSDGLKTSLFDIYIYTYIYIYMYLHKLRRFKKKRNRLRHFQKSK